MISSESSDSEVETVARAVATSRKPKRVREENVSAAAAAPDDDHAEKSHVSDKSRDEILLERQARRKQKRTDKQEAKAELRKADEARAHQERLAKGRFYTVSIAIPGSIIDNAQTKELKTYLAGQIARACAIFQVDEVVVFDDQLGKNANNQDATKKYNNPNDCNVFLGRILQYLETPQYLRKALFPVHNDLKYAGLLNPLDCPHHMRGDVWSDYREGVVVDQPLKEKQGSHVNVGLQKFAVIDKHLQPGVRVTVQLDESSKDKKKCTSLTSNGYDLKVGTSERGTVSVDDSTFQLPHVLIVFGGVSGIEECTNADETISVSGDQAHTLFDMWVNTCPQQGSRTIRSEEAILISMSALRPHLVRNQVP
ncbi:hypothetical protein DYB38_000453 [Aphanomyces astaci]|uniref:Uncharacterized protein n=1 Tax=Aphanomyces astaci TaxID=112090 RepID=A0A397D800_APHAT|nr:hypothetical protein DYB36_000574 [Aphanomyces astaci]RHY59740.1 hypothetical protein DYB38_000453 [Aphanomyces astaci]